MKVKEMAGCGSMKQKAYPHGLTEYGNNYILNCIMNYVNLYINSYEAVYFDEGGNTVRHFQVICKKFSQLKKTPKTILKYGLRCLFALTSVSAALAVIDMLYPNLNNEFPIMIQSLFTYGFYLWAVLTVGALILDFVFQ